MDGNRSQNVAEAHAWINRLLDKTSFDKTALSG
jgi:hypothetical protein